MDVCVLDAWFVVVRDDGVCNDQGVVTGVQRERSSDEDEGFVTFRTARTGEEGVAGQVEGARAGVSDVQHVEHRIARTCPIVFDARLPVWSRSGGRRKFSHFSRDGNGGQAVCARCGLARLFVVAGDDPVTPPRPD